MALSLSRIRFLFPVVLIAFTFLAGGCAALISGYDSEFQCPHTDKGKCVSVQRAYKESIEGTPKEYNPLVKEQKPDTECKTCGKEGEELSEEQALERSETARLKKENALKYEYQDTLYKKLSSLIGQPSTPLVVPPEVMRVLVLSYTSSDNELFTYRYIYFFATEPKWIISTSKEVD